MSGRCEYFTLADAVILAGEGIVVGCTNPQGEGPLFFFVPVGSDAVRVPVCEEHCAALITLYEGGS